MKKKIIIDTDPAMGTKGGDPEDCFAIMLALNSPEIEVLGITTVQGNVPVERGYSNAKFLVEELNKEIPVHTGKPGTYDEKRNSKRLWLAGREEMEQITPMIVPLENEASAESFIAKTCKNNSGDIELVTIGPLTNVAKALDEDPNLNKHINKITMMAGAAQVPGNVTPTAEFNVWADPEAASKVFGSGIEFDLIPLDVCHKTRFSKSQLNSIGDNSHPFCQFVKEAVDPWMKINPNHNIEAGLHLYDSLAMALSFLPELADFRDAHVNVETKGEHTDGETVCEFNESIMGQVFKPEPNARVAMDIDVEGFNKIFKERVIDFLLEL